MVQNTRNPAPDLRHTQKLSQRNDPHSITPILNFEQNNSPVTPCDSLERGKLLNKPQPTRQHFRAAPLDTYSPCSYYVLAVGGDCQQRVRMREDRFVRLLDLQPHEIIVVRCQCGRSAEYGYGLLQRLHRLPSDTLVYDLQFNLHCRQGKSGSASCWERVGQYV